MHGKHVDVWALGVTVYNMLTNDFPFKGKSIPELQNELLTANPDLSRAGELRPLLEGILEKDIAKRTSIKDLITHPWLTDGGLFPIELDLSMSIIESELRATDSVISSVRSLKSSEII